MIQIELVGGPHDGETREFPPGRAPLRLELARCRALPADAPPGTTFPVWRETYILVMRDGRPIYRWVAS